eukprot:9487576-Pyramimonas_sp.AAC.3
MAALSAAAVLKRVAVRRPDHLVSDVTDPTLGWDINFVLHLAREIPCVAENHAPQGCSHDPMHNAEVDDMHVVYRQCI